MENLGNNTFQITNPKTGEQRIVSGTDLPKYGLKAPAEVGGWLPAALGVGGAIAGSIIEPGGGTIVGGGLGQYFGEAAKEFLNHQKMNPSELIKQGATGGIYGFIPETKGLGLLGKIGLRSGVGAASGAGAQVIKDIGTTKTTTQKVSDTAKAGVIGGVAFPIVGGAIDLFAGAARFLGEKLPADLQEVATKDTQSVINRMNDAVRGFLVGHNNVQYALDNGIIPKTGGVTTDVINKSLNEATSKAGDVEEQLQQALNGSGIRVPIHSSGLFKMIQDVTNQISSGAKGTALYQKLLGVMTNDISTVAVGKEPTVSLGAVNDMKRLVGDMYNNQEVRGIYHSFKTFVENTSGVSDEIRSLNEEAGKLIGIKSLLTENKNLPNAIPYKVTPQYIEDAVKNAALGKTKSLDALVNTISLGLFATTYGVIKGAAGALSGIGLAFGLRSTIRSYLDSALENPETRQAVSDTLVSAYKQATDFAEKTELNTALQLLGIRLPSKLVK